MIKLIRKPAITANTRSQLGAITVQLLDDDGVRVVGDGKEGALRRREPIVVDHLLLRAPGINAPLVLKLPIASVSPFSQPRVTGHARVGRRSRR